MRDSVAEETTKIIAKLLDEQTHERSIIERLQELVNKKDELLEGWIETAQEQKARALAAENKVRELRSLMDARKY